MTMRQRSTWAKQGDAPQKAAQPRSAATQRTADIYTMNQEHPQPSAIEYENGDPDSWAETPVPGDKMTVKDEYDGDHVKRNELNFGEFRDDTWKHKDSDKWHGPGKYDNAKVSAERKAQAAERVARAILRTANDELIESTTLSLMSMPATALVATLKDMDKASPESLPKEAKFKRALACAKLAARTLGDAANEKHVGVLGSIYMGLDDPTLKAILKTIAAARVAQQQEEEQEKSGRTSQEQQEEQEEQGAHTSQQEQEEEQQDQTAQQQQEQQSQQQQMISQQEQAQQEQAQQQEMISQQEEQAHGLCPEDALLLDQMLKAEQGGGMAPPPGDELQALFPAAPAGGAAPMMAATASPLPDISFDEDEAMSEAVSTAAIAGSDLDNLFSDNEEVMAQREIMAAHREQLAREGGYSQAGRTASTKGAKKLGAVQASRTTTVDASLESLWDRPQ
jgi:hypothetical protein